VTKKSCVICKQKAFEIVDSYKHYWYCCKYCGNVQRFRKQKYLFEYFLPSSIAALILPKIICNELYPVREIIKNEHYYYDYYEQIAQIPLIKTKWFFVPKKFQAVFKKNQISIRNKRILDISGGPGFLTKYVSHFTKHAIVTEFSEKAVAGMKKYLGIQAVKFDYNTDSIHLLFQQPFDIVIIEYSINFCKNLQAFVSSLKKIVKNGSYIYISFIPPTIGCCLRWQHDEYTYNILYQPETLLRIFIQNGFKLIRSYSDGEYGFLDNLPLLLFLFRLPFAFWFGLKSIFFTSTCNREFVQKNIVYLFRFRQMMSDIDCHE
jgi:2-polyprenyl-3-methyl-5-hydroxy-6-metoxy-1,4-benzoquinol methylase